MMTIPNTLPANGGVSDAEVRAAYFASHMSEDRGQRLMPHIMGAMRRALESFAQSRPPSTQSAGVVELPEHFATICGDGYWLLNLRGPHGHNHINAGWPSKKVYTEDQVRGLLAPPPPGGGKEALSDAEPTAGGFIAYLIDHCEGQTVAEESLQAWLVEHIAATRAGKKG